MIELFFCKNSYELKAVNLFCKNAPSLIFVLGSLCTSANVNHSWVFIINFKLILYIGEEPLILTFEFISAGCYIATFSLHLTLFRIGLFGTAHGRGSKELHPPKTWYPYPIMMKLGTGKLHLKKIQKMYNHLKHPTAISFFHRKLTLFVILENTNKTCILLLFYNSFDFLNVVLINMITILIISANLLLLAPLKQSYFEIMVMTSQFLSMTSSTKFYHINQIIS